MIRAGRFLAGALAAFALVAASGCGAEEEKFSEDKVLEAAKIDGDDTVEGDPFCQVGDVLTSADAIDKAEDKKAGNIITSKVGNVGVVVVPPFPDDCAQTVQQGLNKLDPEEKEEE